MSAHLRCVSVPRAGWMTRAGPPAGWHPGRPGEIKHGQPIENVYKKGWLPARRGNPAQLFSFSEPAETPHYLHDEMTADK